jgi:hypothetical protein
MMHAKFDKIQLSIFRDTKNNVSCAPCGRRIRTWLKSSQVPLTTTRLMHTSMYGQYFLCQIRPSAESGLAYSKVSPGLSKNPLSPFRKSHAMHREERLLSNH